jgi:hypothetical protein
VDQLLEAIKAAKARYPSGQWDQLPPKKQTEAIYEELRRLDAESVAAAAGARPMSALVSSV